MRKKSPCWKCDRRVPGCHSMCKEYKAWKAEIDAIAEKRRLEEGSVTNKNAQPFWKKCDKMNRKRKR